MLILTVCSWSSFKIPVKWDETPADSFSDSAAFRNVSIYKPRPLVSHQNLPLYFVCFLPQPGITKYIQSHPVTLSHESRMDWIYKVYFDWLSLVFLEIWFHSFLRRKLNEFLVLTLDLRDCGTFVFFNVLLVKTYLPIQTENHVFVMLAVAAIFWARLQSTGCLFNICSAGTWICRHPTFKQVNCFAREI